jgi:UDP-3-O-[3-hydroxymyristoyl] glucosamine N-acyltransferase
VSTTAAQICAFLGEAGRLRRLIAPKPEMPAETALTGVAADTAAGPEDVAWSRSPSAWIAFRGGLLLAPAVDDDLPDPYPARSGRVLVACDNPRLAMAQVVDRFFGHLAADREPGLADPSMAGEIVRLGAWVMNARIGRGVLLGPHCTIGCSGMGYERAPDGRWVRFPQLGGVVVDDDVHIAAHATIQRGALGDTLIRRGARIGPHVNVGHNVEIGEDVLIAGHAQVGGGAHIGRGAVIWQSAVVANGVFVGAGAVIGMSAAVRKNVPAGEVWAGNPARRLR